MSTHTLQTNFGNFPYSTIFSQVKSSFIQTTFDTRAYSLLPIDHSPIINISCITVAI